MVIIHISVWRLNGSVYIVIIKITYYYLHFVHQATYYKKKLYSKMSFKNRWVFRNNHHITVVLWNSHCKNQQRCSNNFNRRIKSRHFSNRNIENCNIATAPPIIFYRTSQFNYENSLGEAIRPPFSLLIRVACKRTFLFPHAHTHLYSRKSPTARKAETTLPTHYQS